MRDVISRPLIPYRLTRLSIAQRAVMEVIYKGEAPMGFHPKSNSYKTAVRLFKRGLLNQVGTNPEFVISQFGTRVLAIDRERRL